MPVREEQAEEDAAEKTPKTQPAKKKNKKKRKNNGNISDKEGNKKKKPNDTPACETTDTAVWRAGGREREGTTRCGAPQRDPPAEGVTAATGGSCSFIRRRRGPAPFVRETGPAAIRPVTRWYKINDCCDRILENKIRISCISLQKYTLN